MSDHEEVFGGVIGPTYKESVPSWPQQRSAMGKPNVVLVLLDDVGYADLGCYGSEINTPTIDSLAAGGVRLNNFHTTAICSPSRASLLTGCNPHSVGIGTVVDFGAASSGYPGYRGYLSKESPTLAEVLRDAGYATFMSGKWHLMPMGEATAAGPFGNWPLGRGFDRWFGFHGGLTDQWYPELFADNHAVDLEPGPPGTFPSVSSISRSMSFATTGPDRSDRSSCIWPSGPVTSRCRRRRRTSRNTAAGTATGGTPCARSGSPGSSSSALRPPARGCLRVTPASKAGIH